MKKPMLAIFYLMMTLNFTCEGIIIDERGYWIGEGAGAEHYTDYPLANALADFFLAEQATDVVDLGCGMGDYVKLMRKRNIDCDGFDGNPDTYQLTGGVAQVADLSQPLDLGRVYDWVLSLEVGEHLPKEYETIFIENLDKHNVNGIVLSWAVKGQRGVGHFNEQNNAYIKKRMAEYGYVNDVEAENFLRKKSTLYWFKKTIMVFRKVR